MLTYWERDRGAVSLGQILRQTWYKKCMQCSMKFIGFRTELLNSLGWRGNLFPFALNLVELPTKHVPYKAFKQESTCRINTLKSKCTIKPGFYYGAFCKVHSGFQVKGCLNSHVLTYSNTYLMDSWSKWLLKFLGRHTVHCDSSSPKSKPTFSF